MGQITDYLTVSYITIFYKVAKSVRLFLMFNLLNTCHVTALKVHLIVQMELQSSVAINLPYNILLSRTNTTPMVTRQNLIIRAKTYWTGLDCLLTITLPAFVI